MTSQLIKTSELFKALSGSIRLQIIYLLCDKKQLNVSQMTDVLDIEQSALSHQLAVLRKEKIVACKKNGKNMTYKLASGAKAKLAKNIIDQCGCLEKK